MVKHRVREEERIVPPLPNGISVGEMTPDLQFYNRGNAKWRTVAQALLALDGTHTIKVELDGAGDPKNRINTIKVGVKRGLKVLGGGRLRYAFKGSTLYLWVDK